MHKLTMALKCEARGVEAMGTPANAAMRFMKPMAWCGPWALSCWSTQRGPPSAAAPSSGGAGRRAALRNVMKTGTGVLWAAKKATARP